jgi:hypothetical protein
MTMLVRLFSVAGELFVAATGEAQFLDVFELAVTL